MAAQWKGIEGLNTPSSLFFARNGLVGPAPRSSMPSIGATTAAIPGRAVLLFVD
ncbi:MAG: hypothetical protein WBG92_16890 [Thiohalocapsa sp.]